MCLRSSVIICATVMSNGVPIVVFSVVVVVLGAPLVVASVGVDMMGVPRVGVAVMFVKLWLKVKEVCSVQ